MRCAIIKLSDLGSRWDAGFHIALQENAAAVAELEPLGKNRLRPVVTALGYYKEAWDVVGRGSCKSSVSFVKGHRALIARELALYIVLSTKAQTDKIDAAIAELEKKKSQITVAVENLRAAQ